MPVPRRSAPIVASTLALALCAGVLCVLPACRQSPFASRDGDFARRIATERLRSIPHATFTPTPTPSPDLSRDEDVRAAVEAGTAAFAALERMDLSIERARQSALEHNLDLRVALVDPAIARERVSEEDARFNAAFTLRAEAFDGEFPTGSRLTSSAQERVSVTPGVRIPTRTGGEVRVDYSAQRTETNNEFQLLNPSFGNELSFSLSHQLLRGAGRDFATAGLRVAGYEEQASLARTKLEVTRILAEVDRAYWRLYRARTDLDVRLRELELAQAQLDTARRRVEQGLAADVEIDRARAGAAQRLEAIIVAQNDVLLRTRELKILINDPELPPHAPTVLIPVTQPAPVEYLFDEQQLRAHALANRMELLELDLRLAADAVDIGVARNNTLPLLSLDYRYALNGLGDSLPDAFEQVPTADFSSWTLGVNAEVPLDNEEARSRLRQAILRRIQRLSSRSAREQTIQREVLDASDALRLGWQRILASRQAVIASARALAAEQRQFELGRSTSTDVLNASSNLAQAQLAEVQAISDYEVSRVDLAFASGTVLGAADVEFTGVPEPTPAPDVRGERWPHPGGDAPNERETVP